jgi:hypothetical protein
MLETYKPYKSDKPQKKYFIITKTGKHVYFGDSMYQDFTQHKNEVRKNSYIQRHQKREDWNDPDTAGYWSARLLWSYPTIKEAYVHIKNDLKKKGYI